MMVFGLLGSSFSGDIFILAEFGRLSVLPTPFPAPFPLVIGTVPLDGVLAPGLLTTCLPDLSRVIRMTSADVPLSRLVLVTLLRISSAPTECERA